ncbi:MAG TPA: ATP-binding protein [Steroidobacteraceae bacterium]
MLHFKNTLVGRLAILQFAIHLVLPPVLYYRLDAVIRRSASQTFTRHAHAYATGLAHELELADVLQSPSRTVVFLDAIVQGSGCAYAAIDYRGRLMGSSVVETPEWVQRRGNDPSLAKSADNIYAVSEHFVKSGATGVIFLGFDTRPTLDQTRDARYQIIIALVVYALASVAAAVVFARLVSRPLTQLQRASRKAATEDPGERLGVDSKMVEIVNLAKDLEFMRGELVGTAARLRAEMAQRELEQAERATLENHLRHEQRLATVGTFAGGLAHEFNNILLPMLLYSEEALEDIARDHPARSNVEHILAAALRASNVVSKLLAFSRPPEKHQLESVDPAEVVSATLDLFSALIPANIEFKTAISAGGDQVSCDPTLLSQVVLNLLSNAVYAMRETGGTLSVSLTYGEDALPDRSKVGVTPVVELRVKDSGKGMTRDTLERIFEPFFTTRDVGEGTGLGLSVVHGIVTSIGGSITVLSEIDAGAEFIVVLPTLAATTTSY